MKVKLANVYMRDKQERKAGKYTKAEVREYINIQRPRKENTLKIQKL